MEISHCILCQQFVKTFEILGRKWNGIIIEILLTKGPQRFLELSRAIGDCSDRVLSERLKKLESEGIVERQTFPDSSLILYALTERGEDMKAMMEEVQKWANKWHPGDFGNANND